MKKNELKVTRKEKLACFGGGFNTREIHEKTEWNGSLGPVFGDTEFLSLANPSILGSDETHIQIEVWENEVVWLPRNEIKAIQYFFCNQAKCWIIDGLIIAKSLNDRL